jgi:hypothetical protein
MDVARTLFRIRHSLRGLGGFLFAVGIAWVEYGTANHWILFSERIDTLSGKTFLIVGLAISLIGWTVRDSKWSNPLPRQMNDRDMADLYKLLETYGTTSSLTNKLEVLKKNPKCFIVLEFKVNRTKSVVGYFVAYRLTSAAVKRLGSGELPGHLIGPEHVVPANRTPQGLYVSFLWGENRRARGAALRSMKKELLALLAKRNSIPVFARVGTKDSLRLLTKYQFSPIVAPRLEIDSVVYREIRVTDLNVD